MTLRLAGSTSGYTEIDASAVAGSNIIQLPAGNGSAYQVVRNGATAGSLEFADKIVSGTAVASTSGTTIDFTGIPSWVKRVTVMFNGVSTNGTSNLQIQIGISSGFETTGYASACFDAGSSFGATTGFLISGSVAANNLRSGSMVLSSFTGNTWINHGVLSRTDTSTGSCSSGSKTLSGTLDRVRITTVNGTDTFDAGSINILYE